MGGNHQILGADGSLAFQPLKGINEAAERSWAAEWIWALLAHENVEITPEVKEKVWSALTNLASAPVAERTLTGLSVLLQSNPLRSALAPYTLEGPFGRLLDAAEDQFAATDLQCFETEPLLHEASAVLPVLTYLFHRLEARFDGRPTLLILDEAWDTRPLPHVQRWQPFKSSHYSHVFAEVRAAAVAGVPDEAGGWKVQACASLADFLEMDLRDTAVTWMALAGATIPEIISVTGHSLQSATDILKHYLARHPEMADEALRKMVAWYEADGETEIGL